MSGLYDLEGARKAGITDEDSLSHLASVHGYDLAGARAAGIPDSESLSHLAVAKAPAEPVVEKESPEALGGIGAIAGGVGAAGDVIYSKGRPLFRMAEKAMGMDSGMPAVKPRTFLDPSAVAEQAIERRTVAAPDVTGSPSAVKNWAGTQHEGEFLGGAEYKDADQIKKEALAFEKQNPTQKVLPGSLLAVPEEESKRLAQQKAALAAEQDKINQAEVRQVAQTRAERLGERANLKSKSNQFGAAKGAGSIAGKIGLPIAGGYELGSQGAQAYNRLTRPDLTTRDVLAGGANVVGAGAGAVSMVPNKYRIPAAIIAQGAGAVANFLDKRNPRNEEVEIQQKAQGGLIHLATGGGPKLPGKFGRAANAVQKAAYEFGDKAPGRMTDFLQNHIKKFVVPTQSDRMGGVGGPSFSANSIALPEYKGSVWGSGNEGTAKGITNLAKDERFGGPENQIFVPLLGHQNQHKSNQIVFDKLMKEFYDNQDRLTPELAEKINAFMRSGGGIDKKTGQTNFPIFSGFDINNKDDVALLGRSFDNRGVIAQHAFGGERLDGKKAQIFPYQQRLDELADPTVAGAPTFAVGPRAFKLTGDVNPQARPDLNAAFPYLLNGEDFGVTYKSTPNGVLFQDFQNQWRQNKGKTELLKSGKLPEPGYYENTLGYKVNKDDAERLYPRQEVTEKLLDSMYSQGYAGGGEVQHMQSGGSPKTKAISSGLSALRDMIKSEGRTPVVPVPNRWFSQPEKFPNVQGMVNKTLENSQLPREAFHSGAFIDPRTGQILDRNIYNDVGVLIDPQTGRPMMSAGAQSGIDVLDPTTGSYTKSNLVRQSLFKPTGGDSMLADMPFIATIEKGGMGHKYGLGTEYATPTEMYNTMTGANPTLRPRSRGDVFGMGDVVGQVQVGGRGIPHDVYEKLFVAPKGSDVPGVKLNKAEGGSIEGYAPGGKIGALTRLANKAKFLEPSAIKDRMFHGTTQSFDTFNPAATAAHSSTGYKRGMTFVSPNPKLASEYAGTMEGANVMPVHVQVKNPFDYENPEHIQSLANKIVQSGGYHPSVVAERAQAQAEHLSTGNWGMLEQPHVMQAARDLGHDAMYVQEEGVKNLGIFDPNRIKSAIGNQGTYDVTNSNINKKQGGLIHLKKKKK